MATVAILGAGFSCAAGYPATSALFTELPQAKPGLDASRMQAVQVAYQVWREANPGRGPEQWLKDLFQLRAPVDDSSTVSENDVVQFVLRRLCRLKNPWPGAYYYGISRPKDVVPDHVDFWARLRDLSQDLGVVTFNYDILAEHGLQDFVDGEWSPAFYYGGFMYNQHVQKMVNITANVKKSVSVPLGHEVPIYKLHGSINWAWESHSDTLKIHDDVRAAFRQEGSGRPAIVPPIEEKELTPEFAAIWTEAAKRLARSERWIVCGYSAPAYDVAARDLLSRAAAEGPAKEIELIDPNSSVVRAAWAFPNVRTIRTHDSIRDALAIL